MPEISRFYGIIIRMFYGDHPPPHFHAAYQGQQAQINLESLEIMQGEIPRRALSLVREWATAHRTELERAWELASANRMPEKIEPLE